MKVSFEHTEKKGLFGTKLVVTVHVETTPEEKKIIKQYRLGGELFFKQPNENVYLGRVLDAGKHSEKVKTPFEAEQLQADWTNKLKALKREIEIHEGANPQNTSFEL